MPARQRRCGRQLASPHQGRHRYGAPRGLWPPKHLGGAATPRGASHRQPLGPGDRGSLHPLRYGRQRGQVLRRAPAATDFEDSLGALDELGIEIPIKHAANSAALMNLPDSHLDMVRPGIATYGLQPSSEWRRDDLDLRPALQWKTRIIHLKQVPAGFGVSYGITYKTSEADDPGNRGRGLCRRSQPRCSPRAARCWSEANGYPSSAVSAWI